LPGYPFAGDFVALAAAPRHLQAAPQACPEAGFGLRKKTTFPFYSPFFETHLSHDCGEVRR
jgi:hypothetical protein